MALNKLLTFSPVMAASIPHRRELARVGWNSGGCCWLACRLTSPKGLTGSNAGAQSYRAVVRVRCCVFGCSCVTGSR